MWTKTPIITNDTAPIKIPRGNAHIIAVSHPIPAQFRIIMVGMTVPKIPQIDNSNQINTALAILFFSIFDLFLLIYFLKFVKKDKEKKNDLNLTYHLFLLPLNISSSFLSSV